ncbi:hypothetical protein ACVGXP_02390, partial [Enterobacter hormaechei]
GKYILSLTNESSDVYEPGSVWPQPDSMYSPGNTLFLVYDNLKPVSYTHSPSPRDADVDVV